MRHRHTLGPAALLGALALAGTAQAAPESISEVTTPGFVVSLLMFGTISCVFNAVFGHFGAQVAGLIGPFATAIRAAILNIGLAVVFIWAAGFMGADFESPTGLATAAIPSVIGGVISVRMTYRGSLLSSAACYFVGAILTALADGALVLTGLVRWLP